MSRPFHTPPHRFPLLFLAFYLLAAGPSLRADYGVYQFGFSQTKILPDPLFAGHTRAFLWIPPEAKAVRAVLLAPSNVIERRFCDDPVVRAWAARDGVALLFFNAGGIGNWTDTPSLKTYLESILATLAQKSGYDELTRVPWIPVGHSGNSKFVQGVLRFASDRTLAAIVIKGGMPSPAKDGDITGLVGIPILNICGEYEEVIPPDHLRNGWWPVMQQRLATVRAAAPQSLMNGVIDRGYTHMTFSETMARYCTLYLHEAMVLRLGDLGVSGPLPAYPLKPVAWNDGWLTDPDGRLAPVPAAHYTGDPKTAFWHPSLAEARVWLELQNRDQGKKQQMLAFTQDGETAPYWKGWDMQNLRFEPLPDGVSFRVHAKFLDAVSASYANAGTPLGHSARGEIGYSVAGWAGNIIQTGPDTFRVHFDREGVNGRTVHVVIAASHPGDDAYAATICTAHFNVPYHNDGGAKQTLVFPQPADVEAGANALRLDATVDSPLKPDYYVSWGPARVEGDTLRFTPIPVRARFPVEVSVTAYQWGKATEPRFATANTVTRVFSLLKK